MESAAGSEPLGFGGPLKPSPTQKFHVHTRKTGAEESVAWEARVPPFCFPLADVEPASSSLDPTGNMQKPKRPVRHGS